MKTVAILGASKNQERYSNKAMKMLLEYKHKPVPISPKEEEIMGYKCYKALSDIEDDISIDTVTIYIGAQHQSEDIIKQIINLKPKCVIFNPGTENAEASKALTNAGIDAIEACTLVLLRTEKF